MYLAQKLPPPSDLQPTLSTRPILDVISLETYFQAEVLYVHEPKCLDYPSTNFFLS